MTATERSAVFGRDEELGAVLAFLDLAAPGPQGLLLEGQAGIGKSTVWTAGVEAARERGLRVLVARPAEAERGLAYAGLGDVFEDVLEDVLPLLPAPRRHALEVALLRVGTPQERADPRAVAAAVRTSLELLAAEGPVVLAVDDIQWLDRSSATALAFALRRLPEQPVLALLARRLGDDTATSVLETGMAYERLVLGPVTLGATHALLRAHLGRTFSRPTLLSLHELSGGNPFYALELARAHGDDLGPTQPLAVPDSLDGLVRSRLRNLPGATREALALAAAVGRVGSAQLAAANITEETLEPALVAKVLEVVGGSVRFTHPLLASVVYRGLAPAARRAVHRSAADVVDEPLERARHLALGTTGPDAVLAATLEEAATGALDRGAPIVAAELYEQALRLTPPGGTDDARRRTIAAARAHLAAGDGGRARAIGIDLVGRTPAGRKRAEALLLLYELETLERAVPLLSEALEEAAGDLELQARIHQRLASTGRMTHGRPWAAEHARAALDLAEQLNDDTLRAGALSVLGLVGFDCGDPEALQLVDRAYQLATIAGEPTQLKDAAAALAHVLTWSSDLKRVRPLLEARRRESRECDEPSSADAQWYLAIVEWRAGNWALAADYADRSHEIAIQYGGEQPWHFYALALVALHRGDFDRAREAARHGRAFAESQGALFAGLVAVPGAVDLWSGDAAAAAESFAAAEEVADAAGWREPNLRWWRADAVEALLELGRVDEAVALLDRWEADATHLGRDWVLAQVLRCRGLAFAARGEVAESSSLLERAVARHAAVGDPFGQARALLSLGVVARRARQKRGARDALEAALAMFTALGAASWVARTEAEVGSIGGRTRIEGLSPAEQRVAALVAAGRTNREVAAALFLSERTVASHLTHLYTKLGVRSRTELASKLQTI